MVPSGLEQIPRWSTGGSLEHISTGLEHISSGSGLEHISSGFLPSASGGVEHIP